MTMQTTMPSRLPLVAGRLLLGLILALVCAQACAAAAGMQLERVVLLYRHGVRTPLPGEVQLDEATGKPWPAWQQAPSQLTPHGMAGVKPDDVDVEIAQCIELGSIAAQVVVAEADYRHKNSSACKRCTRAPVDERMLAQVTRSHHSANWSVYLADTQISQHRQDSTTPYHLGQMAIPLGDRVLLIVNLFVPALRFGVRLWRRPTRSTLERG